MSKKAQISQNLASPTGIMKKTRFEDMEISISRSKNMNSFSGLREQGSEERKKLSIAESISRINDVSLQITR